MKIGAMVAWVARDASRKGHDQIQPRLLRATLSRDQTVAHYQWGKLCLAVAAHPLFPQPAATFQPEITLGDRYSAFVWGQLDRSSPSLTSVLDALVRQGPAAAAALSGDFIVVLVDTQEQTLTVIRDPLGNRSAFWRQDADGCWMATNERCLWPARPTPDPNFLASYFAAEPPPPEASPVAGVATLAPAHAITLSPKGVGEPQRYWQFTYDPQVRRLRPTQAAEQLRQCLTLAVKERVMEGDAVAISGGMDSTAAAAVSGLKQAFTYRTNQWPQCQEHELAAATCQHLQMQLEEIDCDSADPLSKPFWETPSTSPGPELDAYQVMRWRLATAAASRGCRGVMTGDFGDQIYLGYPYSLRDGFVQRPLASARVAFGRALKRPAFWRDPLLRRLAPANGISRGFRQASKPWLTPRAHGLLARAQRHHPIYGALHQVDRMEGCLNAGSARAAHLGYLQGLGWGVEYRMPYRHQGLVQFMLSLPAHCLLDPISGQTKPVMRRAMAGLLPPSVLNRPDKTSLEPLFRHAVLDAHGFEVRQLLAASELWRDYLSEQWLEQRWQNNDWNGFSLYLLWCCISVSHWHQDLTSPA